MRNFTTCTPVPNIRVIEIKGVVMGGACGACGGEEKYSDTSANEDNSFRNHIR